MNKLVIKRCLKCGATVEVLIDCKCKDCGITCCGENMVELKANTSDGAKEKHIPVYKKSRNKIIASVPHVMEKGHYIEWIALVSGNEVTKVSFKSTDPLEATFPYISGSTLYACCNKHGVWSAKVL